MVEERRRKELQKIARQRRYNAPWTFNILATVYFYLGARHEEISLQEEFGEQHEDYKKKVPMFLPRMRG